MFAPEAPTPPITVTDLTPATEYVFRVGVAWASDAGKPIALYSASSVGVTTMTVAEEEEAARKKEVRRHVHLCTARRVAPAPSRHSCCHRYCIRCCMMSLCNRRRHKQRRRSVRSGCGCLSWRRQLER